MLRFFVIYKLLDTNEWSIHKDGTIITRATYKEAREEANRLHAELASHGLQVKCFVAQVVIDDGMV